MPGPPSKALQSRVLWHSNWRYRRDKSSYKIRMKKWLRMSGGESLFLTCRNQEKRCWHLLSSKMKMSQREAQPDTRCQCTNPKRKSKRVHYLRLDRGNSRRNSSSLFRFMKYKACKRMDRAKSYLRWITIKTRSRARSINFSLLRCLISRTLITKFQSKIKN